MVDAPGDIDDLPTLEMSQAESRYRGVTRQTVHKLVSAGKIPVSERDGRKVIDVVAADRLLGETRERVNIRDDADDARPAPAEGAGLTKAKTATEVYRARLAQLEYEERVARLVAVADVRRAAAICAEVVDRALELPFARLDGLLAAAAKGMADFRGAWRELIREQRTRCAESFAELAAGAAGDGGPVDVPSVGPPG